MKVQINVNNSYTIISTIAFYILLLADSLFLIKYGSRVANHFLLAFLLVSYLGIRILIFNYLEKCSISILKQIFIGFIFFLIALSLYLFSKIDPATTLVDRWDAIVKWWDAWFLNKFPYSARTRWNGFPSPLPFLQYLYLPFYLIGEIGFGTIFYVLILCIFIYYISNRIENIVLSLFIIISSVLIWREISVRSSTFSNGILILMLSYFFFHLDIKRLRNIIFIGIISGFALSTRFVTVLPIAVFVGYFLRNFNLKQFLIWSFTALVFFIITFLPILFNWEISLFLVHNPFLHHDNHMPRFFSMLLLTISFFVGYFNKNIQPNIFSIATILTISAIFFVRIVVYNSNFYEAFFDSKADISYIALAYPCLVYCSIYKKSNLINA